MSVHVIHKADLENTPRHVKNEAYETYRFLLASDHAKVTVTDIVLNPGIKEIYGYENHIEIAYCIEGEAELTDLSNQAHHHIGEGSLWVAQKGAQFSFLASEPTRLICVFSPPFTDHETGFAGDR